MDTSKQERQYNEAFEEEKRLEKIINEIHGEMISFSRGKMTNDEAIQTYDRFLKIMEKYYDREAFEKRYNVHDKEPRNEMGGEPYSEKEYRYMHKEEFEEYDKVVGIIEAITKEKNKLEAGKRAEIEVQNDVKLFLDKAKILHNCRFVVDVEIDMLIIATKGIFCVEIKGWGENAEFTESGYLKSENKSVDVAGRMRRYQYCIEKLLEKGVSYDIEIIPLLLWQNRKSEIKSNFKKIPICYKNTLEDEIFTRDDVLSNDEVDLIYACLKEEVKVERKYDILLDKKTVDYYEEILTRDLRKEFKEQKEIRKKRYKNLQEKKNHPIRYVTKSIGKGIGTGVAIVATVAGFAFIVKDD